MIKERPKTSAAPDSNYTWQFSSHMRQLIGYKNLYPLAILALKKFDDDKTLLLLEIKEVCEKAIVWTEGDTHKTKRIEKDIERTAINKMNKEAWIIELLSDITFLSQNVFGFWSDIHSDYLNNYISKDSFNLYLESYRELLSQNEGLSALQKSPADKILEAIHNNLPPVIE